VAATLEPATATPAAIQTAVRAIIGDPQYRERACEISRSMHAMPELAEAVRWLEELVSPI
jgi:UDP:flavonoid glycosyltransferase YjiC (YdhE family)